MDSLRLSIPIDNKNRGAVGINHRAVWREVVGQNTFGHRFRIVSNSLTHQMPCRRHKVRRFLAGFLGLLGGNLVPQIIISFRSSSRLVIACGAALSVSSEPAAKKRSLKWFA